MDELINRVLEGDNRACRQLYDRYARAMFNTALRITGNHSDAEDVLQESFLAAFSDLAKFAHRASFGAWLKQIVVHKSLGCLKKRKITFSELSEETVKLVEEEPVDEASLNYTVEKIRTALQQLPPGYRTVLSLHLLEGYDYEEVAEILDLSASTIRTQYMRGKQKLLCLIKQLPAS